MRTAPDRPPTRIDVAGLLARVDLAAIISADRGQPDRAGRWLCPYHDDHNPSLGLTKDRRRYRCWACGATGTALDWIMKREGRDFLEAAARLDPAVQAPTLAVARPAAPAASSTGPTPMRHATAARKPHTGLDPASAAALVDEAARRLWSDEGCEALHYLEGRGLTRATIHAAGLGWHPGGTVGTPWKAPGVTIPWRDGDRILLLKLRPPGAWRERFPLDRRPRKYLEFYRDPDHPPLIYPSPAPCPIGAPVIVTEGELDCLLLGQALAGLGVSVATLGSSSATPDARVFGLLLGASAWYVATDADAAGDSAAVPWLCFPRARRVRPPIAKDWTDCAAAVPGTVGTGMDLRRWWSAALAGDPNPPPFVWVELARQRWGPALDDPPTDS